MVLQGIGVLKFVHQYCRKAPRDIGGEFFSPGPAQGRIHLQQKIIEIETGLFLFAPPKFRMQIVSCRQQNGNLAAAGHFAVQGEKPINKVKKAVFRWGMIVF